MIDHAMAFIAGAALSFGFTQLWAWETRRMERAAKRDELADARATLEAKFNAWMDSHADQTYAEVLEELFKYSRHSREITSAVIRTLLAEGVAAGTLVVRQEPMSGLGLTMAYHVYRRHRPQELLQVTRPRVVAHMEAYPGAQTPLEVATSLAGGPPPLTYNIGTVNEILDDLVQEGSLERADDGAVHRGGVTTYRARARARTPKN